jgi:uncharacterized protein with NAD-binding domain and iron-sulfur cluster
MTVTDVFGVIDRLHEIIANARQEQSRIGYFAALYLHVAMKVQECVEDGLFANPLFIQDLNVAFFNRYFDALDQYQHGQAPTKSWLIAFEAARSNRATVDQHLLLGINAHINLDLGIAVARVCKPQDLAGNKSDFDKMTAILLELFEDVMKSLGQISPLLGWLDTTLATPKDVLIRSGMTRARIHAWNVAVKLAPLSEPEQFKQIRALDDFVAGLGRMIWPAPLLLPITALFRMNERGSVPQVIDFLTPQVYHRRPPKARVLRPASLQPRRERVVVLGGGIAALTAAFELTDPYYNPHYDRYDVTVYQMGWRLGGKGASGRNVDPDYYYRIEEHGLHAWFGFYENAFNVIRRCYDELDRPPDAPLARWHDAFKPLSVSALIDTIGDAYYDWPINTPPNDLLPGNGHVLLPIRDYVTMALKLMHRLYRLSPHAKSTPIGQAAPKRQTFLPSELEFLVDRLTQGLGAEVLSDGVRLLFAAYTLFERIGERSDEIIHWFSEQPLPLAQWLGRSVDQVIHMLNADIHALVHDAVLKMLHAFMAWLWGDIGDELSIDVELYRTWIALNLIYANVRGMIEQEVITRGFEVINDYDYRDWLAQHAFPDGGLMAGSELVAAVYDSSFAYIDGKASFEAGTALQGLIRTAFTYRGAFGFKMQAGTGDTLFAPLYQVLKRRGVKFEFFHRVKQLRLHDDDKKSIGAIEIARQVWLEGRAEGKAPEYDPLIDVKGLACWPSQPRYEQIEGGEALRDANLETIFSTQEVEPRVLELGRDFDKVILGIPIDVLPHIASELIEHSQNWRDMITNVKTVGTQALQLWLRPTANELGWPGSGQPIMSFTYNRSAFPNALNAWGDMSHLISRENWISQHYPLSLAYFCSAMDDTAKLKEHPCPTPHQAREIETDADDQVLNSAEQLLDQHINMLWPKCWDDPQPGVRSFRWKDLIDALPKPRDGRKRLRSQYWRANLLPSERYVLSVPGSSQYRLPANNPDEFSNLYLAGDWTENGLNCGCMEAAVMSGRLASLALCGYPMRHLIIGVDFGTHPLEQDQDRVPLEL